MVGPLLRYVSLYDFDGTINECILYRYDTVDEFGIWHGAAMIVTADSGSIYEPHPTLTYQWDPDQTSHYTAHLKRSFDLGPHPADPHSTILPTSLNGYGNNHTRSPGSNVSKEVVPGQEIYVYGGPGGCVTFRLSVMFTLIFGFFSVTAPLPFGDSSYKFHWESMR